MDSGTYILIHDKWKIMLSFRGWYAPEQELFSSQRQYQELCLATPLCVLQRCFRTESYVLQATMIDPMCSRWFLDVSGLNSIKDNEKCDNILRSIVETIVHCNSRLCARLIPIPPVANTYNLALLSTTDFTLGWRFVPCAVHHSSSPQGPGDRSPC